MKIVFTVFVIGIFIISYTMYAHYLERKQDFMKIEQILIGMGTPTYVIGADTDSSLDSIDARMGSMSGKLDTVLEIFSDIRKTLTRMNQQLDVEFEESEQEN